MYWACLGATSTCSERKASGGWLPLAPLDKQVEGLLLGIILVSSYRLARSRPELCWKVKNYVGGGFRVVWNTVLWQSELHFGTEAVVSAAAERGLKLGSSPRGSPSGDYLSLRETFCLRSGLIQWHGDGGLVFHTNWGHSAMPSQIQHSIQSLSWSLFPGEPNMPQRHRRKKKIIGCLYFRTSYVSIKKTSPSWSNCMRRDFY